MRITHKLSKNFLENEIYQGETGLNVGFLTANQKGDFASFFNENQSRYQGWFFRNFENVYKLIENISLEQNAKIVELKNEFWRHVRISKINSQVIEESFFLPENNRGLVYEINGQAPFNLFLDFKPIYDTTENERFYKIEKYKKGLFIECQNKKEKIFLVVKFGKSNFSIKQQWVKRNYTLDAKRNSLPFERYVFWAFGANATKMVIGVGNTKRQAFQEANYIFNKTYKLKKEKRQNIKKFLDFSKIKFPEISMAYWACQNALRELIFENSKQNIISAGLPWFFDFYSRDAFISIKPILHKNQNLFWKICQQSFSFINENGLLPNKFNDQKIENADAVGWLFKRIGESIEAKKINEITIWKVKKFLEKSLENCSKSLTKTELVMANGNNTWMDSIDRTGERIELQALRLYMLKLAYNLTNDSTYKILEASLKFKVKEKFWNGQILFDSPNDQTIRPNIFLAYYIYPELLEQKEWQTCFDNALKVLWLNWGGISTIDKTSYYFQPQHTGENSQSYHSGDSWFYLNNLTAIVLYRNNPERYRNYIEKIIQASSKEILLMRAIGCHGEISSAESLTSQGCWSQAWSSALFIELINELYKK